MSDKICPIMTTGYLTAEHSVCIDRKDRVWLCYKERCEFWNKAHGRCSIARFLEFKSG